MKLFNEVSLENNEKFLMKGLKFNFHQHVVKSNTFSEETNSLDTTYIDGKGNYHILKKKWYYEEDGIKKYIKKDEVYLDSDKKLKFSKNNKIYEVKYEEGKCDNLILINIENTYNYPKVYNPTKQKRYYILLNNGYKKYIFLDENKNLHFPNYFYCPKIEQDVKDFSQKDFLKYENVTVNAQNELKFNGQYVFNIDYIEKNLNSLTKEGNNKYSFERKISTSGIVTKEYVYIEETCASNENSENIYLNENINNLNAQINQVEEQIKQIKEYIKNYNQQINNCLSNQLFQNYSLKFKELSKEYRNSMEQIQNVSQTNVTINSITSSSDKDQYYLQLDKYDDLQTFSSLSSISLQRDSLVEEYYKLVDQLNEFNDLKDSLVSYKNSLITEQKMKLALL